MHVVDADAKIMPLPAEPFALIVGQALRHDDADALEQAMRRMGLRPERLTETGGDGRAAAPRFRLRIGALSMIAGPAGDAALDDADPVHPSTSLLAASLPTDWRMHCWTFVPEDGGKQATAGDRPDHMRELFKLMVLTIDLFDASHIFWSPAKLWSDAQQFRASVAEMLVSGMPPVLHLVAFRRRDAGDGEIAGTRGLSLFAGQELEGRMPHGWTVAEMVKRLARLALDMMLNGPVGGPERLRGLDAGEWVMLSPQTAGGSGPPLVRVEFGWRD